MFHILVVEDDQALNKLICRVLNKNDYETYSAADGEEALALLDQNYIDLIITDLMMPNLDGFDLTKELRDNGYQLPILVVTARDTYLDKAKGFKLGIDDYMVKPIDVNELLLRVEALLRRAKIIYEKKLEFGPVCLDYINLTVTVNEKSQILPQKEFQLLYKLLSSPNHTFTRQQIMDELWGYDSETDARTVDVHVNRIRDRYREVPYFQIQTVRGLGYKGVIAK
ncbi:MAG: response regulator transcription factor [Lachnospiraceae bacterium]|nr:response regulator transcription factor [Lachnospiraceae bacterium]